MDRINGTCIDRFCGCSSLDFDTFKDKPKEKTSSRSKYSILAEPGDGAKVIDPGSLEEDMIKVSENLSEPLHTISAVPEDLPTIQTAEVPKDVDALFKNYFQILKREKVNISKWRSTLMQLRSEMLFPHLLLL